MLWWTTAHMSGRALVCWCGSLPCNCRWLLGELRRLWHAAELSVCKHECTLSLRAKAGALLEPFLKLLP